MTDTHARVINDLAAHEPCSGDSIARRLGIHREAARYHLRDAERLGCVTREGRTRGTLWRLA